MPEKLKRLLAGQETDETLAETAYEMVCQYILNYCGLETLPAGLEWTAAAMTADYLKSGGQGEKRVTLGDTTVEYFAAGEKQGGPADYRSQLNRYRRLFHDS